MYEHNLMERVTDLLMNNGCTINAKAMRELTKFISERDESIILRVIKDAEKSLAFLQSDSKVAESE